MVKTVFADAVLLEAGWACNARISYLNQSITGIETDVAPNPGEERHAMLLPGLCNLHSHAFQRGMSGLAETRGPANDSFWSWRETMYRFAHAVTPDQVEAIAAQLYMEMLEQGFTRVGEFHYLHNDTNGKVYSQISELAQRIMAASQSTGIALTLLPVFYAHSGFGGGPPTEKQNRFILSLDQFARLQSDCATSIKQCPGGRLGVAPHSLRAVTPDELKALPALADGGPVHIHIAEQTKEVEDCLAWSGMRPVEWLLHNMPVDQNWTLIHATHVTDEEVTAIARQGAVAGLCPITEANLGDGIFPASRFLEAGGLFGVGSDSNVLVSLPHELQQLEYSQRLALRSRNVIAHPQGSTGQRLYMDALKGGTRSLHGSTGLSIGQVADMVSLDVSDCPYMPLSAVLDAWIFGSGPKVGSVWVYGQKCVNQGVHKHRDQIASRFRSTMTSLLQQFA